MDQVLRQQSLQGSDLTLHQPDHPDWVRSTLSTAGFETADIERTVIRRQVESVLGRVARAQMQHQMMRAMQLGQGLGQGGPLAIMAMMDRAQIQASLASEGLSPEQIEVAMQSWDRQLESLRQAASPGSGGSVLARAAASGEILWSVQVHPEGGPEITRLTLEGGGLLIRDETGGVHRLNLATRALEPLPQPEGPYAIGDEALPSEQVIQRAMPGLLERLDRAAEQRGDTPT
jgi:hypothetical protein